MLLWRGWRQTRTMHLGLSLIYLAKSCCATSDHKKYYAHTEAITFRLKCRIRTFTYKSMHIYIYIYILSSSLSFWGRGPSTMTAAAGSRESEQMKTSNAGRMRSRDCHVRRPHFYVARETKVKHVDKTIQRKGPTEEQRK